MVLLVLWRAPLTWDALRIAAAAASGVLVAIAVAAGVYRAWHTSKAKIGALILAAAFPNVTYLGLPVLEKTFGPWARSVAIQYALFACTPLLLTLGFLLALSFGSCVRSVSRSRGMHTRRAACRSSYRRCSYNSS